MSPDAFIERLKSMPLADIAAWFTQTPTSARSSTARAKAVPSRVRVPSRRQVLGTQRGYGQARRPQDYLQEFSNFIRTSAARFPPRHGAHARVNLPASNCANWRALTVQASEANLNGLARDDQQDVAARIEGYIRAAMTIHQRALTACGRCPAEAAASCLGHSTPVAAENHKRRPGQRSSTA